jgi:hypothetical protein
VRFAKEYLSDYQAVVSTHIDTGLVHNHIEFNATSFITGKKFNDTLKEISKRREVSDRICGEYGLDVLEDTRNAKFVTWTDGNDKTRFFEPTTRKNERIAKRDEERLSKADVGSFVNTDTFGLTEAVKETNVSVIQRDIDMLLPDAVSFDHLVYMLREIGYRVRDKKKDGDYMTHISYTPPEKGKATREDKLGEEYTREALTERIEEQERARTAKYEKRVTADKQISAAVIPDRQIFTAVAQDKEAFTAVTPDERIQTAANIPDKKLDEAVILLRKKYISQTAVTVRAKYISLAVTDMTAKHNEFTVLRNRLTESWEDIEKRRIAYLKDCIRDDIALVNYIEDNGAESVESDERHLRTLKRLGVWQDQNRNTEQDPGADRNRSPRHYDER